VETKLTPPPPSEPEDEQIDLAATCRNILERIAPDKAALRRTFKEVEADVERAGSKLTRLFDEQGRRSLWDELCEALGDKEE
jgi:hypothetical protein